MSSEITIPAIRREQQSESSMLALIDRAARDPSVDVAKMEQLLALAERVHDRDARSQYDQAMNAAQSEMRPISRDCHNPQTRSRYASYEAIDNAIRPVYTNHGFALSFGSKAGGPDRVIVTCRISHRAGHVEHQEVEMPADGKGAKGGDVMTKTHAVGSALSYGKRYLVNLIFNLSFGEADDDGNAAGRVQSHRTTQRPVQTVKTPGNSQPAPKQATAADVGPAKATEKTREWMLGNLKQFAYEDLKAFTEEKEWILGGFESPEALLNAWPLDHVPTNRQQLGDLIREIEQFIAKHRPPSDGEGDFSEPFWDAVITVPRAKMRRADYMTRPDTIRSLYEAMKGGSNDAKIRLFGLAKEWQPREWEGSDGKMRPPSRDDVECRAALDEFLAYEEAKERTPDLIP
jgi:hypothetical protein